MSNPTQQPIPQAVKVHEVGECVTVYAVFSKEGPEDNAVWDYPYRTETVTILEVKADDDEYNGDNGQLYWVRLPTAAENEDCRECYMYEYAQSQAA